MSKNKKQQKGTKHFAWNKISETLQTGARPKTHVFTWAEKRQNSFSSSEEEVDIRVSARQQELLKCNESNSGKRVPENYSRFNESKTERDWIKSARQRKLIDAGSSSSLLGLEKEQSISILQKKWLSTAQHENKKAVCSSWRDSAGSSRSIETGVHEINRYSAGSTRQSECGAEVLVDAVRHSRIRHTELLLDGGLDPNIADHEGVTPLIAAVADVTDVAAKAHFMQRLLDSGADPNIGDIDGTTALMYAASNNFYEAAVILLQHETTDPGQQNNDGNSALMYAAYYGHSHIVLLILAAFKKVHHITYLGQCNCKGFTAFVLAEQNGFIDTANLLRADNHCAPCPKGISGFVPAVHQLSRSPSPTDRLEFSGSKSVGTFVEKPAYCSSRPPSPATDLVNFESLSLKALEHLDTRDVRSSPGSGNEADTESLMDGDQRVMRDKEIELLSATEVCMSAAVVATPSVATTNLSSSKTNYPQPVKILRASGNLLVDRNAVEKLRDMNYSVQHASSSKNEDPQRLYTMNSQNLNPIRKKGISSHAHGTPNVVSEVMPNMKFVGSSKSLNRSIQSLVHEDNEFRPGHRPPTPARPSLPTLRHVKHDSSPENSLSCSSTETTVRSRRINLSGLSRASSEPKVSSVSQPRRPLRDDEEFSTDILEASTKSEGWDALWGQRGHSSVIHSEGHVVPLPPIDYTSVSLKIQNKKIVGVNNAEETVLSVAKNTLDTLDDVLSPEVKVKRKAGKHLPRSRTVHQMTT